MLSETSRHAIRALVYLGQAPRGESLLGRQSAEQAGIPADFLAKIMLTLRNAEIVEAARGQGGGYRPLRRPGEITLVQVVSLFDGNSTRSSCLPGEKHAWNDEMTCSAHPRWKAVHETYLQFMTTITIRDLGPLRERANHRKAPSR